MKRILPVIALGLAGCIADGSGPGAGRGRIALAVSAEHPTAAAGASVLAAGDSTVIRADSDTVIIRGVDLVVRRIELKPVEVAACESDSAAMEHEDEHGDSTAGDDSTADRDSEGCEEIKAGPVLVSLPLGDTAIAALVDVSTPAGQYNALEFRIHAPELPRDSTFLTANPGFAGVSIRVTGTFSHKGTRTDFTFESSLEAEQELRLDPPLVVDAGGVASVTLRFNISGWFAGPGGSGVVDPGSANAGGANAALVRENIQRSIDAFEDRDHDGHDDGDLGDDHDGGSGGGDSGAH
jgi:hypothetical protein